jgi:hypothetical protein
MVAEALVVLHIDHADDLSLDFGDERHVLDAADVAGELQPMGGVLGRARGNPATELDKEARHRRPVIGDREPDDDLAHTGHTQGR